MPLNIETRPEPNGRWSARVLAVPGLVVFGSDQKESLAVAKTLAEILLPGGSQRRERILVFYPGCIPDRAPLT